MKKFLCVLLAYFVLMTAFVGCAESTVEESSGESVETENSSVDDELSGLSEKQLNSVAMLNYLAMISQKIESSKNNRIYLEEIYSSLLNNTNPVIDETTQDQLQTLLNIIKEYRQIELKRERLNYIYEQDKAKSIKNLMPDPLTILTVVNSFDWKKMVASIAYTAASSYANYKSANDELDRKFLTDGWELDDEETEIIHMNRTRAFNYMVDMVRENEIPGFLTLNEESIENFVKTTFNTNPNQKLQFFTSKEEIYENFGPYWLELAKCHYELEDYKKCLDCFEKYEAMKTSIFRYDFMYADYLPMAITAAQFIYDGQEYIDTVTEYAAVLNSPYQNKWDLKYFAAQTYIALYAKRDDISYLKTAYEIVKSNVNALTAKQEELNETYLNEVKTLTFKDSDTFMLDDEELTVQQKGLDDYNASLKEKRKTELPELYEPLIVNCELLFSLAEKLEIDDSEKSAIEGILSGVFIVEPIKEKFSFGYTMPKHTITMSEDELVITADILDSSSKVFIFVNSEKSTYINDFVIEKVERTGKEISSFKAIFKSENFGSFDWKTGDELIVVISNGNGGEDVIFNFVVDEVKKGIWDSIKSIFGSDTVIFKCVD